MILHFVRNLKEKGIEFIPVAKQDLVLIVPYSHPLAAKDTIDLKETIPYPQIVFNQRSGLRYIIDDMFKKINQQPNIVYEVEEDQVIAGLVAKFRNCCSPKYEYA